MSADTRHRHLRAPITALLALFSGCAAAPQQPPDASAAVPDLGALRLRLHVPPERPDLSAFATADLKVLRSSPGYEAEPAAAIALEDGRLRIEPMPGELPTRVAVELRGEDGALVARADSGVVIARADEPDRDLDALWLPAGEVVSARATSGAPLLPPLGEGGAVTALDDGRALVSGGGDLGPCAQGRPATIGTAIALVDAAAMRVEAAWSLLVGRSHHGAARVSGGKVALLGGYVDEGHGAAPAASVELAVPHEGRDVGAAVELGRARARFGLVGEGEDWILIGGDEAGVPSAEVFSLSSGTRSTEPIGAARLDPAAALVYDERGNRTLLLIAGGYDAGGAPRGDGLVYVYQDQALQSLGSLPALAAAVAPAWLVSETPLTVTRLGGSVAGSPTAEVLRLTLANSPLQWQAQSPLATPRSCGASAIDGGTIWLFGGAAAGGASAAVDEVIPGASTRATGLGKARVGGLATRDGGAGWLLFGGRSADGAPIGLQRWLAPP